jgi:dTDP-glucose 4,6-dehydratase
MRAVVLSRNSRAFADQAPHLSTRSDFRFVEGDVRNFDFPTGKFPFVIHAAASTGVTGDDDSRLEMLDEIVAGTRRVLDFAAHAGARKLLFTSSGAVYGPQPAGLAGLTEDYPGAPDSLRVDSTYGVSKRLAEQLTILHARRFGYEAKIARCFAFVGPHLPLDGRYAIGNFIRDALAGEAIRVKGDGTPFRSYLYAADLAVWLWTILFRGTAGRAYNVGSEQDLSIADLAETVRSALDLSPPVLISRLPQAGQPCSRYVPDTRRARTELGLAENVCLQEGIRRTARWHAKSGIPQLS